MTPMQQILLGVGVKKKVYMEDVFSTYLYKGNGGANQIVNGIDNTEESMIWFKNRTQTSYPQIHDTIRGGTNYLLVSESNAAGTDNGYHINTFNNNGFTLQNSGGGTNANNKDFVSWNFKSASGFFDVVTYTGNGSSGRAISHSLKCIPGCIMVKCTSDNSNWRVYHRGNGTPSVPAEHWALSLNQNVVAADGPQYFNDTLPTSTHFTVGNSVNVNDNAKTYVAYLFAGGESTAATARSVDFDGSNDFLFTDASSDLAFGTGDFTIEFWARHDTESEQGYFQISSESEGWKNSTSGTIGFLAEAHQTPGHFAWYMGPGSNAVSIGGVDAGVWYHIAIVRASSVSTIYVNGIKRLSQSDTTDYSINRLAIGRAKSNFMDGQISNFRVVKGTAVYTSSFRPPTEPLTNITNTTLLCCNNSSNTGKTVGPTITSRDGWSASSSQPAPVTDSPFDDPAGFAFGDNKEGIIKCGSYIGNGNADGPEINLGWEPQWILLKNADSNNSWRIYDSMRGIITGGDDELIHPDSTGAAYSGNTNEIDLTSTGFKVVINDSGTNTNNGQYTYMAIRRSDSYVGKPAELGTDVFAMDAGNSSTTQGFTSGFPVDFALDKKTSATSNWEVTGRMIQEKYLLTNSTNAEATYNKFTFDDMTGWNTHDGYDSVWQSWMWKRHAGFDVVTYAGVSGTQTRGHSLGVTPEMIWVKCRTGGSDDWCVGHKDLTGGFTGSILYLNGNDAEVTSNQFAIAPTSTHWSTASGGLTNNNGGKYLAMLFASVKGVSHCGTFTGNGSTQTITIPNGGFQPRFLIMKCISHAVDWQVLDTTRGWASGNDPYLELNTTAAQYTTNNFGEPTSTGFTLNENAGFNGSGRSYIYYAHA